MVRKPLSLRVDDGRRVYYSCGLAEFDFVAKVQYGGLISSCLTRVCMAVKVSLSLLLKAMSE